MDAGAKPLFPPKQPDEQHAKAALLMVVRREPRLFGHRRSRWRLPSIPESGEWLALDTLGGLSQLLMRLGIRFKRARAYIHSPDPDYQAKVRYLTLCRMRAWYDPQRYVFVYDDWPALKQAVWDFIAQFDTGSIELLPYVGLFPD